MREIPLTRGYAALVDDEDYERVLAAGPWCARPNGRTVYGQRALLVPGAYGRGRPTTTQALHTFVTGWPYVDHRNGDGLDNQRSNLRPATSAQNAQNRRLRRDSTSGYKGVTAAKSGRWKAQIQGGGHRHLGYHDTAEEAARAYDAAALEVFGEFARLNFPKELSA